MRLFVTKDCFDVCRDLLQQILDELTGTFVKLTCAPGATISNARSIASEAAESFELQAIGCIKVEDEGPNFELIDLILEVAIVVVFKEKGVGHAGLVNLIEG